MSKLIYTADDDIICRDIVRDILETEGYQVKAFETGDQLYISFLDKPCNLVILDAVMPGNDGIKVCSMIRRHSDVPIIILTALDSDDDYVSAISQGSDVYLTKPVNPAQLTVYVRALLAKAERAGNTPQPTGSNVMQYGDIAIYPSQLSATCKGNDIGLTKMEVKLLAYMFENHPRAISREEFLDKIWGYESQVESRATDDTVKRLRKKLSEAGSNVILETVRGLGFKLGTQKQDKLQ